MKAGENPLYVKGSDLRLAFAKGDILK